MRIHSWDGDLQWNKTLWEKEVINLQKQNISLNLSFIMCHSQGISFVFVVSLQAIIIPYLCILLFILFIFMDFIPFIQKILIVLIAAIFIANLKIIVKAQHLKGRTAAIVRATIINIPLRNISHRYRKHIHGHNAKIFKKYNSIKKWYKMLCELRTKKCNFWFRISGRNFWRRWLLSKAIKNG